LGASGISDPADKLVVRDLFLLPMPIKLLPFDLAGERLTDDISSKSDTLKLADLLTVLRGIDIMAASID